MGQVQSDVAPEPVESRVDDSGERISSPSPSPSPSSSSASPPSMESLISKAAAFGEEGGDSLEDKAQKALDCPCIAHLRSGSCGDQFSEAFLCFLKSTAEEKGSDCVNPFVALQDCIKAHPDAFSKDVLEEENEEKENEVLNKDYKIHPPNFAKERRTPKPKL